MKSKQQIIFLSLITIMLVSVLLLSTSCEPPLTLEVKNKTNQTISIYVHGTRYFDVLPNTTVMQDTTTPIIPDKYFIEGLNQIGEIVYSRILDREQFVVSHRNFLNQYYTLNIVITSSEDNPYLPLEIQNSTEYQLEISIDDVFICWIEPGETVRKRPLPADLTHYKIEAVAIVKRYTSSKTVYSRVLTHVDLEKLNWKIVIQ